MKSINEIYRESFYLENTEDGRAFLAIVRPLLHHPAVHILSTYRHHMSTDRLQHVTSVAYLAYHICREQGLAVEEVCHAALLHDLFYFDSERGDAPRFPWVRHPVIAWENARELYPFTEVGRDIICHHMWPLTLHLPRTREGRIVSWADKYCAMREFFRGFQKPSYIRRKDTRP
ncbi:MAG: HD domain-containing protein [Clostridia bacterium]|nr:HD domain-containing protein [Clostridia bacterium]